jgi:hypothetical protein
MPLTADGVATASLPPPLKIWTPCAADLVKDLPTYPDMCKHFDWHWRRRHPVVVREIQPGVSWRPVVMESAMKDIGASPRHEEWLHVIDCQDGGMGDQLEMEHEDFFKCVIPARASRCRCTCTPETVCVRRPINIHHRVDTAFLCRDQTGVDVHEYGVSCPLQCQMYTCASPVVVLGVWFPDLETRHLRSCVAC